MCLKVHANGVQEGAGTHVSMSVNLMRGEYDDKLTWPFCGDITMQVANQNRDQNHVEEILDFADENAAADDETSGRVTSGERAKYAWGYPMFISHIKLESAVFTKHYLKNDCIIFRVTKVVVH